MFVHETDRADAARKMGIAMVILFAVTASVGALFTLHVYVKRSPSHFWFS
jgi:hypothetical protein